MGWVDGVEVTGARPDGTAERVRFSLTLWQRVAPPLVAYGGLCVVFTTLRGNAGAYWRDFPVAPFTIWAAFAMLVSVSVGSRVGVTLSADRVVVRRIGSRVLRWPQIAGVTTRRQLGVRQVVLVLVSGERVVLRAPAGGFPGDPRFEEKYHTIGRWWAGSRGLPGGPSGA